MDSGFTARHLVDGLLRELSLHSPAGKLPSVPLLHWSVPTDLLDSADITELMYFLGRRFQLGEQQDSYYCLCINAEQMASSHLALFRGLGFNALEVTLPKQSSQLKSALECAMTLATDFHFEHIALRVPKPNNELISTLRARHTMQNPLPPAIILEPFSSSEVTDANFTRVFEGLRGLGYRVLGNDYFVASNTPLANAQASYTLRRTHLGYNTQNVKDIVGMGPGGVSAWGNFYYRNPEELTSYLRAPFNHPTRSPFLSNRIKLVLDQLLSYHAIDLKYFLNRYQWNLTPIIEAAWKPYWSESPPLFFVERNRLSITTQGLLRLQQLCHALIQSLSADR